MSHAVIVCPEYESLLHAEPSEAHWCSSGGKDRTQPCLFLRDLSLMLKDGEFSSWKNRG